VNKQTTLLHLKVYQRLLPSIRLEVVKKKITLLYFFHYNNKDNTLRIDKDDVYLLLVSS